MEFDEYGEDRSPWAAPPRRTPATAPPTRPAPSAHPAAGQPAVGQSAPPAGQPTPANRRTIGQPAPADPGARWVRREVTQRVPPPATYAPPAAPPPPAAPTYTPPAPSYAPPAPAPTRAGPVYQSASAPPASAPSAYQPPAAPPTYQPPPAPAPTPPAAPRSGSVYQSASAPPASAPNYYTPPAHHPAPPSAPAAPYQPLPAFRPGPAQPPAAPASAPPSPGVYRSSAASGLPPDRPSERPADSAWDEPPAPARRSRTADLPQWETYEEYDESGLRYAPPTADELAARRTAGQPQKWVATTGLRGAARRGSFGLLKLRPSWREAEERVELTSVRRPFKGLRQITVVNPKGGAGKTVATLMLGLTFGRARGGFVLAWDNNETQGTLGMRAHLDQHSLTVRDLLRDLHRFQNSSGGAGELATYVRPQDGASFDVLASDEAATAGEMLTGGAFREIRDVVGRFYRLLVVDTGNNARAENWQAAIDATDQLVITMSARNDSVETAARLLDHLEQTGRRELVRRSVGIVTIPGHRSDVDPGWIEDHFEMRCRAVLRVPFDRHLDSGGPVDYAELSAASRRAWLSVAAMVAEGL